jgi:sporulation protein YlmC with PRC-barrel domain
MMYLVSGLLDKEVLDRRGESMGRVDGVGLELRDGEPPRIAWLEVSGVTILRRLHPRLGAWAERWRRRHGPPEREPLRIPWERVRAVARDIKVDLEASKTPARAWEQWLRDRVVARIPGA